ncbi:protoporphyrinogen oxidase [Thalassophryne amazonica]|uniref:protoporphyrinogen oxidase n=1 Tax=Thalassophryne amazonica TaxID=390379 RepID=UPI001470BA8E|nr:protoporphyrinogen oxidase [Thalassophryne amazonica]XP_034029827.1 protoporphyrinogen oxidase [Thalassophryne amazonica]
MRTVAVIGGGIGGLAASYYLSKVPQITKVVLLESTGRYGGWLSSTRTSDGAVFEHGPRGIRPVGPAGHNTLNLVEDLDLTKEILPVTSHHVASKNRYLFVNKQLYRMPSGISGVFRTVPPFSRPLITHAVMEMLRKKGNGEDESIHSFVSRRLGKELADIVADAFCRGVFAGDSKKLSIQACFPSVFDAEQRAGSVILGMLLGSGPSPAVSPGSLAQRAMKESWAQWSLSRGMEALPEAMTDYLAQGGRVQLHKQAPVKHICPSTGSPSWEIHVEDETVLVDHIVSAVPAKVLSSVLPSCCQLLIEHLRQISTVTVAVVNLEYEGSVVPAPGFGHLVPSSEDRGVLGVVYDSLVFPQHNRQTGQTTRLTVMMGGAWFQEVFGDPDQVPVEHLRTVATRAVQCHLGISTMPSWSHVAVQKDCIPQYHVGHRHRVESIRNYIRTNRLPLSLVGASYEGVSVSDVIFSGRTAVEELCGRRL